MKDQYVNIYLQKKKKCANCRSIFLLSLPGKVYAKYLEKRCREIIELQLQNAQCRFRPGRPTISKRFTLQKNFENCGNMPKSVYMLCIPYKSI